ncbi:MAG TPA: HEAT repeat domain-containing protein [Candidatus Ozemobacteraceae bacterium]|nr:HEAT repeat domain-containing protein [Candidatus Ozemobacteraceae bacterium]
MDPYTQKLIESFPLANKERKVELIEEIGRGRSDAALQFMINALGDEHWIVRKTAADQIYAYQDAALPALSAAINSYSEDIQHWALQVLCRFGSKGTPSILRAVKSTNHDVRYFAAAALGDLREPMGVTALIRLLGDEKWPVRKAAAEALSKFGEEIIPSLEQVMNKTADEDVRFWAIKTLGRLGPKAQKILLESLRAGDKQMRYVIASALGESGDTRVIRVLIESLADPDWTIRKSATQALADIGGNAVDPMIEALQEPNEEIRDGCLIALVRIGDRGLTRLFAFVEGGDDNQRYLVRKGLVKLGSRVVEPLIRFFRNGKPEVMSFCAAALGEIASPKAVPVLIEGLSSSSWNVRRSCAYALTEVGEKGVDRIAEALNSQNDDVRYWVTRILESIGEGGMPYLVKALNDKSKNIRYFAAKALGGSSNPDVIRDLIKSLADPSWSVRRAASESITRLENFGVDQLLRAMSFDNEDIRFWIGQILEKTGRQHLDQIHENLRLGDRELRLCCCQALGVIADPSSVDILMDALRDESDWVRIYAAIALGKIGDTRAVVPLLRGLSDRNAEVHRNIGRAFRKLGAKVFETIAKCVESDEMVLRRNSAIAIRELAEERGVDLLVMMMSDAEEKVRQAAAEALGRFPGLKARTILGEALADKAYAVRVAALTALAEHAAPDSIRLIMDHIARTKEERELRTAKRQLVALAQRIPAAFIPLFSDEHTAVRTMAAEGLVGVGLPALPVLNEAVQAEGASETVIFWCNKVMKTIRNPQEPIGDV